MKNAAHQFKIDIETDDETGEILAVYFQVRAGKSAEVREFCDGRAIADYNRKGELLGIELLGPCNLRLLDKIEGSEPKVKQFIKRVAPREMVPA